MASNKAADARMTVPQTLPDSRATVEKSAVAKASARPTMANRNRTQTCDSANRGAVARGALDMRSGIALLIRVLSGAGDASDRIFPEEGLVEVTEGTEEQQSLRALRALCNIDPLLHIDTLGGQRFWRLCENVSRC